MQQHAGRATGEPVEERRGGRSRRRHHAKIGLLTANLAGRHIFARRRRLTPFRAASEKEVELWIDYRFVVRFLAELKNP
jgi:hypothetical protein